MSLSIEVEWIDQPHALDELERRTWADLRIFGAGRCISRVFDRATQSERRSIFVPVLSIAEWIVENWWALLYEPSRVDDLAKFQNGVRQQYQHWERRHCLRASESGLLLPELYVFGDGDMIGLQWLADPSGAFPSMPGEFTGSGRLSASRDDVIEELRSFVATVRERVQGLEQPRTQRFLQNWEAISQVDSEEAEFCRCAGRLGLDPYATSDWDPAALSLLESELGAEAETPLGCDFLESINDSDSAISEWRGINELRPNFDGGRSAWCREIKQSSVNPAELGYQLANQVRDAATITRNGVLRVDEIARTLNVPISYEDRRQINSPMVGWSRDVTPRAIAFVPPQRRSDSRRFIEARALFFAAFQTHSGPRLCTRAHTWSQRASRAFAAELLAPQTEVLERWHNSSESDETQRLQDLARQFEVSDWLISHQLENAGRNLLN